MQTDYKNIVFLTGAGISAQSGLATFRGANGLWNNHSVLEVATLSGFFHNPSLVYSFYNDLKKQIETTIPNAAHYAITKLQQETSANVSIITQNIDVLHEKAKSQNVFHIHGQINQAKCLNCGNIIETWSNVVETTGCPRCKKVGKMKPNVVFFGEEILYTSEVEKLLATADLFIAVGTSGEITPASTFAKIAQQNGAKTIAINLEKPQNANYFDKVILGDASVELPLFIDELLQKKL